MEDFKYFNSVAKVSDFSVLNSKFTRGRCRIMYTGRNRNYTDITEEALNKLIERKGYANVPVIAHLYKGDDGKWRVGGHDSKFVITADGFEIIDETVPFGVIPEDCNPAFEEITEQSGEVKKYFCVDIILWTHRYNIMDAAKSDELWFNQSMEININHCDYDRDDYCIIDDFDLSALCLLNHDPYNKENEVEPCFPSASVNKFGVDKFKQEFKDMYAEFNNFMKGEISLNIDKVKSTLDGKYFAVQVTDNAVIAAEKETFKVFSIPCTENSENGEIVFDYDKAVEKFMSVSDKDTGFSVDAVKEYVSEYSNKALEAAKVKFADEAKKTSEEAVKNVLDLNNGLKAEAEMYKVKCAAAEELVAKYVKAEEDAKFAAHKADIDRLIGTYEEQLGLSIDFINYKKAVDYSKSEDQVNKDLLIMLGQFTRSGMGTVQKYSASWGVNNPAVPAEKKPDRYAGLLDD
ncbi:MAG: hypothetical protein NC299_16995 [Lachnospiraceae bacterium]|nr:hypothetical protein [Lachnospiraceae bacterium]